MATFLRRARGWSTYRTYEVTDESDLLNIATPENGDTATDSSGINVWVYSDGDWVQVDESGSGTDWGDIGGTLSNQTDLQTALDSKQASDTDLTALAGLSSTGLIARTGAGTAAVRTITGSTALSVADGDGVAGNPTLSLDADLVALASAFAAASASGPASLALAEDTDNGSNTVALTAPSSVASNKTVTLQDVTGTVYVSNGTDVAIADGGTGQSTQTAAFDALSPLTTRGDLIYRDASNNVRLAKGTSGQYLSIGANDPAWANVPAFSCQMAAGDANGQILAASTTYYYGVLFGVDMGTVDDPPGFYVPVNCTLVAAYGRISVVGTLSSGEDSTVVIRKNATTDILTVSTTAETNAVANTFNSTGNSVAVSAGDRLYVKLTTGAFVTAPTATFQSMVLYFTVP